MCTVDIAKYICFQGCIDRYYSQTTNHFGMIGYLLRTQQDSFFHHVNIIVKHIQSVIRQCQRTSGNKTDARDYIEGLDMLANMRLCANVPGQWAVQTALVGYQGINELIREGGRLRKQRDLAYELVPAIPGVTCVKPEAALYMFPRLDPAMYPIADDREFFLEVLKVTRVMLVQGSGFNFPDNQHFRIVFLPHEDELREAIGRLAKFLENWRLQHGTATK